MKRLTNKQKKLLRKQQMAAIRKRTGWKPREGTRVYLKNTVTDYGENKQ